MNELYYTTQAKKDLKRYRGNPTKMKKLFTVLNMLANEIKIPKEYKPHFLAGNYKGCLECHIENDFLLIWLDPDKSFIEIIRIGSHSELFK